MAPSPNCNVWQAIEKYVLVLLVLVHCCNSEMFTAMVELEKAIVAERSIAIDLKQYILKEEERLQKLKTIADDYDQHSQQALTDINDHLANPINAFLLVKRFTADWNKVEELINNNSATDLLARLQEKRSGFPDHEDLNGAAMALLRLQDTYALPTNKMAKGELQGIKESPEMTANDCFELGKISYNSGDHYHCIMWMSEALEILNREEHETADRASLLDYLAYSHYVQGNIHHALTLTTQLLQLEPDHQRAVNNKNYYEQLIAEEDSKAKRKGDEADLPEIHNQRPLRDYTGSNEFSNYEKLCRGEDTEEIPDAHKLSCQYVDNGHPWLKIGPLKEEVMYHKPLIRIYHQSITDSEMELIKELAAPRLNRATVQNALTGQLETANYRISKSAWLREDEHPLLARLNERIKAMTNLNLETAEELQVVNYGIGGHYEPHYDFARPEEKGTFPEWQGNRVSTVLFYMTDVPAGGATVFPTLGVKLFPEKGAAAFWHNLLKSGEGDYATRHAGCPVLTGQKWVSNKWIHERGQELHRPCGLTEEE